MHLLQSLGHAEGRIAREGSHLKDALGLEHEHQQLEQAPLQVAAHHASMNGVDVGGAPKAVKVVALGLNVIENVVVESHHQPFAWFISASNPSMAKR